MTAVQVTTLIPVEARETLGVVARESDMGVSEFVRKLIFDAIGAQFEKRPRPEKVPREPRQKREPKPAEYHWQPESVLDLASRGFTGQQIAARLRMPYRAVMAEMARQIDDAVNRDKARMVHGD